MRGVGGGLSVAQWGPTIAMVATVGGGGAWIATRIGDVRVEIASVRTEIADLRTDFKADVAALDSRLSAVEAKLDLVIEGLDIQFARRSAGES